MPLPVLPRHVLPWSLAALLLAAGPVAAGAAAAPAPLVLKLDKAQLAVKPGVEVAVGYRLDRAAALVVRVKSGPLTVDILRRSAKAGRGTMTWDGKLGARAAPSGTYRLAAYAATADGATARASATLTIAP